MLFQTKMQTEIKAADAVIARWEKIRGAIAKDVEALGRLAQKIDRRRTGRTRSGGAARPG